MCDTQGLGEPWVDSDDIISNHTFVSAILLAAPDHGPATRQAYSTKNSRTATKTSEVHIMMYASICNEVFEDGDDRFGPSVAAGWKKIAPQLFPSHTPLFLTWSVPFEEVHVLLWAESAMPNTIDSPTRDVTKTIRRVILLVGGRMTDIHESK